MQHVPEEKHLAWLLRVFAVLFAIGGFLFLFFPQIPHFFKLDPDALGVIGTLKEIAKAALKIVSSGSHWNVGVTITERFWVFSFFSMMMTITACSYIASLNVRKYRKLVIPVLVEKSFGSSAALLFFLFLESLINTGIVRLEDVRHLVGQDGRQLGLVIQGKQRSRGDHNGTVGQGIDLGHLFFQDGDGKGHTFRKRSLLRDETFRDLCHVTCHGSIGYNAILLRDPCVLISRQPHNGHPVLV